MLTSILQSFSESPKFRILTARDENELFSQLERGPDLVLLDIHFMTPKMDGMALIGTLREQGFSGIICMLTEDTSSDHLFEAAIAGADGYIARGTRCDLTVELEGFFAHRCPSKTRIAKNDIEENLFLRSVGLTRGQRVLLGRYATLGFPRVKEFAHRMSISETSLWKRLGRIRNRLGLDSMPQVAHLLTALSLLKANLDNTFRRSERSLGRPSPC